jgi:hypothetical protein
MTVEDLKFIFKKQIDEGTEELYYMLVDGDYKLVQRHLANDMESLLPLLDNFIWDDTYETMPRFVK